MVMVLTLALLVLWPLLLVWNGTREAYRQPDAPPDEPLDAHGRPRRGGPRYLHDTGGNLTSAGDGQPFKPWGDGD